MERIVRVGQYLYHLSYTQEGGETPVITGIDALTQIVLFNGEVPIMYDRLDSLSLTDAAMLTLDMEAQFPLLDALVAALTQIPKSDPTMQSLGG